MGADRWRPWAAASRFDHVGTQVVVGRDDEEWADFLAAIYRWHGTNPWTCRELLDEIQQARLRPPVNLDGRPGHPKGLTVEDLPSELTRVGMGVILNDGQFRVTLHW